MIAGQGSGARDGEDIDLDDAQDVSYWMSELEVGRDELEAAVRAVGASSQEVRAHLEARFSRF